MTTSKRKPNRTKPKADEKVEQPPVIVHDRDPHGKHRSLVDKVVEPVDE